MRHDDIARSIGARLREARSAAGWSRKRLAEVADVSERYLVELEKGEANASIGILDRVSSALSLTILDLFPSKPNGVGHVPEPAPAAGAFASLLATMSPAEQLAARPVLSRWLEERRRAQRGVALLGLRGAGKSTLGRLLAERHGLPFVSITREVETRAGMNLADLFNLGGPDAYRTVENEVARDLAARVDPIVLETAGGIVENGEALDTILSAFRTIWLKASPQEHLSRVAHQGDLRPMHGNPKALEHLKALLAKREGEYARAELVLDTAGRPLETSLAELVRLADL